MPGIGSARAAAAGIAAALLAAGPARSCALALALALDISSSVNEREYDIQIGGLAAALRAPDVVEAILTQPGPVWIAAYEWSGAYQQDMILDWTRLDGPADVEGAAVALDRHARTYRDFATATGRALRFGAALLGRVPAVCAREVIDISGDGVSNDAEDPSAVWAEGTLEGITVNALVIPDAWPDPAPHYRDQVIGGPGAFMMIARNGYEDYPELIRGKLLRELKPPIAIGGGDGDGGARRAALSPEP